MSTISTEERREVARRLRGQAKKLGPNMDAPEFAHYTADVIDVNECMTWYEMELRLADLIEPEPERTCQDVEGGNFFRCSKCGCELMRFADGWKPLYMGEVRYCPNCGARVVEEEK